MQRIIFLLAVGLCSALGVFAQTGDVSQGMLAAFDQSGSGLGTCPLKHTDVRVEISGFLARVRVRQEFENNFGRPIEAVYKFPLPENSAVDDMLMRIGERTIRAKIMRRTEAREIYETAKADGKTAALLDQERPNIFTQRVANILPNDKITVEISFVETLRYEDGVYEFVFPMTVGERYTPASMSTRRAALVTPRIVPTRAGHDISIEVDLDAGVPVEDIRSGSHQIETLNLSANKASVKLKEESVIPNKDFILRYQVTGKRIEDAILTHRDERGGFFTLILSPPEKFAAEDITPKELVFLLDVSGSMSGFPLEKAKEAMRLSLAGLNPNDTFNLMTFAGNTQMLFEKPVPATRANLQKARSFLATQTGGGGTEMMTAIRAALAPSDSQKHLRIVCFMTDGFVGNDMEIIGEVQRHPNARVFAFGIGSSVNRLLLDKVSETGRGEAEYITLEDDGTEATRRFYERVRTPLLTDVSVDWNALPVVDVYPRKIPDLFSAKPVIIHGRYLRGAKGTIRLSGKVAGQELVRDINVDLPASESRNDVLATLWARTKIDELMREDWQGIQNGNALPELEEKITRLGLDFRLLTQYTSFVAVEDLVRTQGGRTVTVEVPTENPEGVRIIQNETRIAGAPPPKPAPRPSPGAGSGSSAVPKTISGGVVNGKAFSLPAPALPMARNIGVSGSVSVQVVIDENGNVISSSAVSGHPLLRAAAEQAARKARFAPTQISGQPVRVTGIITYVFSESALSTAGMGERRLLQEKMHPQILEAIEILRTQTPESVQGDFIEDGKARVEIWLTQRTPEVLEKLKSLGFVLLDEGQNSYVVGFISLKNLADLAAIEEVQYVMPKVE